MHNAMRRTAAIKHRTSAVLSGSLWGWRVGVLKGGNPISAQERKAGENREVRSHQYMSPTSSRKFSSGQIALFMLTVLPVLTVAVIWATDWGTLWINQTSIQKAADGAALAGANYLPVSPSTAHQTAINYATANLENCPAIAGGTSCPGANADGSNPVLDPQDATVSAVVSGDQMSITVTVTKQVRVFLAPFLTASSSSQPNNGNSNSSSGSLQTYKTVTATSTASLRSILSARGMLPMGIDYDSLTQVGYSAGQTYALTEGQLGQQTGLSSTSVVWYALSYPGEIINDTYTLINDVTSGFPQLVTVGEAVYGDSLASASIVQQQVQQRIILGASVDPSGTALDHTLLDPRAVTIPVVSATTASGGDTLGTGQLQQSGAVKGFAKVWLNGTNVNGEIDVTFINQVSPNSVPIVPEQNLAVADFGVYQPVLVQ
jgi:hypothetical protein